MKQLKRLHLSNLKSTEMGKLWGGYDLPPVVVTPSVTSSPYVAVTDNIRVTPPVTRPIYKP